MKLTLLAVDIYKHFQNTMKCLSLALTAILKPV